MNEPFRQPLTDFLAAFYKATDWSQFRNSPRHDFFERRVQIASGKRNFRQVADVLARNLGLSALPVESELFDVLKSHCESRSGLLFRSAALTRGANDVTTQGKENYEQ